MATAQIATDAITFEIDIAAPPARVFRALTDQSELMRWFHGGDSCPAKSWKMDARLGGQYSYETAVSSKVSVTGVNQFQCHGQIREFDPPRLLAYTWIANWHLDHSLETLVRWELTPEGAGTHVKVTHSNLASEDVARKDYAGGWPGVLEKLKQFVE